jgi:hypothetical protein
MFAGRGGVKTHLQKVAACEWIPEATLNRAKAQRTHRLECGAAARFGLRREEKRYAAFRTAGCTKAVSPLRSATAVQNGAGIQSVFPLRSLRLCASFRKRYRQRRIAGALKFFFARGPLGGEISTTL